MKHAIRLGAVPGFLLLCLLLGGASAAGIWQNMALQLIALVILAWAFASNPATPLSAASQQAAVIVGITAFFFVAELVPLPPEVWTHLPGRAPVASGFGLLHQPLPWLPLTLEPYRAIAAGLWTLPALAVFFAITRLGAFRSSWMVWVLAVVALASVAIGALQLVGGAGSSLYFYQITNVGAMTGFFANANHLATLLVSTIPFLAALYARSLRRGQSVQKSSGLLVVLCGTLVVIFAGILSDTSLAGIGLSVPVLGGSVLLILSRSRRVPWWSWLTLASLFVASTALVFSAPFNNNLTGAQSHTAEDSRYIGFSQTAKAARDYLPVGSGIGTFQQIYRSQENPATVDRFYMNHAHNDYLELALETGVPGLLILLLFLLWWASRTHSIWISEDPDFFARAATIASAGILVHSVVDYPLRTAAIGAVFAMCCALMADPRGHVRRSQRSATADAAKHLTAD